MPVAKKIAEARACSFGSGRCSRREHALPAVHGCDKVSDFSIGNPNLGAPASSKRCSSIGTRPHSRNARLHAQRGLTPRRGLPWLLHLAKDQGVPLESKNVVMTCGAGAALNVIFKAILDPGDEVLVSRPYFVEYGPYADNHGGVLELVAARPDFDLDLDAIAGAIRPADEGGAGQLAQQPHGPGVSGCHPGGPGGVAAPVEGDRADRLLGSDEPIGRIVYDGVRVPAAMAAYENTIIAFSYSKELSLAGRGSAIWRSARLCRRWTTHGRSGHGQPYPGFRERSRSNAASRGPAAGGDGGRDTLQTQPRRAL